MVKISPVRGMGSDLQPTRGATRVPLGLSTCLKERVRLQLTPSTSLLTRHCLGSRLPVPSHPSTTKSIFNFYDLTFGCDCTLKLHCGGDINKSHLKQTHIKFGWLILSCKIYRDQKKLAIQFSDTFGSYRKRCGSRRDKREAKISLSLFLDKKVEKPMEVWIFSKPKPFFIKLKFAQVSVFNSI